MKRREALAAVSGLALSAWNPTSIRRAAAQETTTLRVALVTPRGSRWQRVFAAWANSLRRETDGRISLDIRPSTAGVDETSLVHAMQSGEIDAACFTALGLGQIAPRVLVLQAPGVVNGYEELDRARARLSDTLQGILSEANVSLLGWTDFGRGRIFSKQPVASPEDLGHAHPWVAPGDPVFPQLLRIVGSSGVELPIARVAAALDGGSIDTVVASSTAVSGLQWHTRLRYVTEQTRAVLTGATLIAKSKLDALDPGLQATLLSTATRAHETLQRMVRADDETYYRALTTQHSITPVDASPNDAAWQRVAEQTREQLVGTVFDRALLREVLAARG